MAMADEEEFERCFLEPLLSNSFDFIPDPKKEMHMGGDADNRNCHYFPEKTKAAPPYNDLTVQTLKLKNDLRSWREVILLMSSIILWEKTWYPHAIITVTSMVAMLLWLAEPSMLTVISLTGLLVTLADYFVPIVAANYFNPETWSKDNEEFYEETCHCIVERKNRAMNICKGYFEMRTTKPKTFYPCTIASLLFLTYLGCNMCNLALVYLTCLTLLLWPGIEYNGFWKEMKHIFSSKISALSDNAKQKLGSANTHPKDE